MWMVCVAIVCRVFKALVLKMTQIVWYSQLVPDDETGHGTPATLGIDGDDFQFSIFHHQEFRLDNLHFLADTLPVKQMLHFLCSQMNENAVISLDRINQQIGQKGFLMQKHCLAVQLHLAFHPIGVNHVERTQETIEKRSDPKSRIPVWRGLLKPSKAVQRYEFSVRIWSLKGEFLQTFRSFTPPL